MKKYIITWNAGYGEEFTEIEVEREEDAQEAAYKYWREDVENNADYDVIGESTDDLREECGLN